MITLYKTSAVSVGGRDGNVKVENSPLEFEMAPPVVIGKAKKVGANPEQLFAAGYSACFGSAVQHVIKKRKLTIAEPSVRVTVGLGKNLTDGFELSADILVTFSGIDQEQADSIAQEAGHVCPYSNATRNNISTTISAKIE